MKKLLFMILALLPVVCSAQITGVTTKGNPSKTIAKFHGNNSLELTESGRYCLMLQSTNKLDDYTIVWLGESKESAIATLEGLIGLVDSLEKDGSAEFDTMDGKGHYRVIKHDKFNLNFQTDGVAGNVWLATMEINKCLKALQK
jgi:hypothetical protein